MEKTKAEVKPEVEMVKITRNISLPVNNDGDGLFVPDESEFQNVGNILEQISVAIRKGFPVLLSGETGTGKTSLVRYLANKTKNGFRRVNHNGGTSVDDIVGKILINKEGTYWVDGVLIDAMRKGYWYLADEINASSAEINFIYHSLLDDDSYVVLPENGGEIVRPHKNFKFFATLNPASDYQGTKELNKALMSRFIVLKTDFPSPTMEAKILHERTGIDTEVAKAMIRFAGEIRAMHAREKVGFVLSTRDLLMWAAMYQVYRRYILAAEMSVLNKVSADDFDAVQTLLSTHFKALDDAAKVSGKTGKTAGTAAGQIDVEDES